MKKILILFIAVTILSIHTQNTTAQPESSGVLNGVYEKIHVPNRIPVPFEYLREADVMWSKTIWRIVDLNEKINLPLYYPTEEVGERMSLIQLLMYGIESKQITAYNPSFTSNEFKTTMTMAEVTERFGGGNDTIMVDDGTGTMVPEVIEGEVRPREVKQYIVKELWFFDKQRSVLDVRIIGICPIRHYYKPEDVDQEQVIKVKLFWVYYPEIRPMLAKQEVFNPRNDAERKSYDDIFIKRMFSSYIIRESNVYNNRDIKQYTLGIESLLEAERIKNKIFNFEQDLWEY